MKDELYIDNKAVDIDDNTNITLNYKSNLFTEVSKIVSNNTYSIKLPMTVRNCNVIDHAHLPTCSTRFPRINHKGRYLRNGVEIVSNASVTLMEVSDTIDIAMAWGNVSAFAEIVNGDKTLQDLSYGMVENEDYIVWSKDLGNSPRLPWLSYGYKRDEPNAWFHPAVSAKWVLDKISKDSGVKFAIPESRQNFVERLVIPLLTRNDAEEEYSRCKVFLHYTSITAYLDNWVHITFDSIHQFANYYIYSKMASLGDIRYISGIESNFSGTKLVLTGNIVIRTKINIGNLTFSLKNGAYENILTVYPNSRINGTTEATFNFTLEEENSYSVTAKDIIYFAIESEGIRTTDITYMDFNLYLMPISENVGIKESSYNPKYYYVPNLPDIKQIDFIKAISALCGMFAIPDAGGIRFITMDEIVANKSKALNWTKRVVASYPQNRPKMLSFSLDNFAQKNIYKWKDDEEGENDGIIYVDDKTLDEEEEVITLPFAASEIKDSRTGPYTEIPLYSYNENGELEYNDNLTPRLLIMENETIATFEGLDWKSIIDAQYKVYQEEVREPKVITELIEIPDYELKKLDMSVPVYLGQYGKFYAIISIKAEKTGICECKLFQL